MNLGTTATTPRRRGRRPKLKVVGGDRRGPRHRVVWGSYPVHTVAEFWTIAEWNALPAWEKPENAGFLPEIGYIAIRDTAVSREEHEEVVEEYSAAIELWKSITGLDRY